MSDGRYSLAGKGDQVPSPWLDISLADYEGHMASPHIGQARLLSNVFAEALNTYTPRSAAVLGCAGGNGLEQVDIKITARVVCVDVNPAYVEQTRIRFGDRIPGLEPVVGDIQADCFSFSPVELVFAGLLFEYVDVDSALTRIGSMLRQNGTLVTVVQLLSPTIPEVTPSPFRSLDRLSAAMRLVSPESLAGLAAQHGLDEIESRRVQAADSKWFHVQTLKKARI